MLLFKVQKVQILKNKFSMKNSIKSFAGLFFIRRIVFPQIVNALIGGKIVEYLYGGNPIYAIVTSGVLMILGAFTVSFVDDQDDLVTQK